MKEEHKFIGQILANRRLIADAEIVRAELSFAQTGNIFFKTEITYWKSVKKLVETQERALEKKGLDAQETNHKAKSHAPGRRNRQQSAHTARGAGRLNARRSRSA